MILSLLIFCPLIFAGLAPTNLMQTPNGEMYVQQFGVYISNPSPFSFQTSRLQFWVKDSQESKTAHSVSEEIPKTQIPSGAGVKSKSVLVSFSDNSIILNNYIGVTVECDGIK